MPRTRTTSAAALICGGSLSIAAGQRRRTRRVRASLGHRRERPVAPGPLRLSVVIPAYQEPHIEASVRRVRESLHDVGPIEIIVVDDGSADETAERARRGGADQVIVLPANRGKGAAVRAGVLAASGRTVAFTDADLSYAPRQIVPLMLEAECGWDVVIGSRDTSGAVAGGAESMVRALGHRGVRLATRAVLRGRYTDTQCGLKAFRSDAAIDLFGRAQVDRFAFDIELLHLTERGRWSVREVPVALSASDRSSVHVIRDTARLARDLVRIRWWAARGAYDHGVVKEAVAPRPTAINVQHRSPAPQPAMADAS
jgi:dolichyl-phosphate beta-glucosyltransferase